MTVVFSYVKETIYVYLTVLIFPESGSESQSRFNFNKTCKILETARVSHLGLSRCNCTIVSASDAARTAEYCDFFSDAIELLLLFCCSFRKHLPMQLANEPNVLPWHANR
jgi:hypothetical protein